eukprot:gene10327-20336_t
MPQAELEQARREREAAEASEQKKTAEAAEAAVPGDAINPLKAAVEEVEELELTIGEDLKELREDAADFREELEEMAARGRPIEKNTARLERKLEDAEEKVVSAALEHAEISMAPGADRADVAATIVDNVQDEMQWAKEES